MSLFSSQNSFQFEHEFIFLLLRKSAVLGFFVLPSDQVKQEVGVKVILLLNFDDFFHHFAHFRRLCCLNSFSSRSSVAN